MALMRVMKNHSKMIFFMIFMIISVNCAFSTSLFNEHKGDHQLIDAGNEMILRHPSNNDDKRVNRHKRDCEESITTVNGKKIACKGELLFEENFDQNSDGKSELTDDFMHLNSSMWRRDVRIPTDPDYEFCVFHKLGENIKVSDGVLKISPSLLEDEYGPNSVYNGLLELPECSGIGSECVKSASAWNILPPIISTRLTTRDVFNFRYVKIDIRAQFPRGDWIYPEMWLQSTKSNARIVIATVRGNDILWENESTDNAGSKRIEFLVLKGSLKNLTQQRYYFQLHHPVQRWNDAFHVYSVEWTKDGFFFRFNDYFKPPVKIDFPNIGKELFQEDFFLMIGLGVGGVRTFPDNSKTKDYDKPWKNFGAKAMLKFWRAKNKWLPSWQLNTDDPAVFKIDYVKIWSV